MLISQAALYQKLCWRFRMSQGAKQRWFLSSEICRLLVWDQVKNKGCLSTCWGLFHKGRAMVHKGTRAVLACWTLGALWREPWFCGKVTPAFISQSVWRSGHLSSPQLLLIWGASDVLHKFRDPPAASRRVLVCVVKVKHVDERGLDVYECWSSVLSLVCPLGQGSDR